MSKKKETVRRKSEKFAKMDGYIVDSSEKKIYVEGEGTTRKTNDRKSGTKGYIL
jgi:hypothetical protein